MPVCRQAGDGRHLPLEVEDVGGRAAGIECRVGHGREGGTLGARGQRDAARTAYLLDPPAVLVRGDPRGQVDRVLEGLTDPP